MIHKIIIRLKELATKTITSDTTQIAITQGDVSPTTAYLRGRKDGTILLAQDLLKLIGEDYGKN